MRVNEIRCKSILNFINFYFLFSEVVATDDVQVAFNNIDAALLVGAMPRKEGMERKDLLKANTNIFVAQGKALDQYAKKTCKVGNDIHTSNFYSTHPLLLHPPAEM